MYFILEMICLKKIKDGTYVTNLDGYAYVGTHWIALYEADNEIIYFDSFGLKSFPKEIEKFIGHKNKKETYLEYNQTI